MKILGIDVSRGSITVCPLEILPREFKRYREGIEKFTLSVEGVEGLLAMGASGAILEPTGGHYSRLWALKLEAAGVVVRWVEHGAIDAYRKSHRCPNKSDLHDAVALACYGLENWERLEYFIRPSDLVLKEHCLAIQHLNRSVNGSVNRLKQQLNHEWPEVARFTAATKWGEEPPPLLRYIAGEETRSKWGDIAADSIGTGIGRFSRMLAQQVCMQQRHRAEIERAIELEIEREDFKPYRLAMERCGITAYRCMAALIVALYPFERFLKDGRIIYERIETKTGKRARRNRSRAAFKLACGLGMIWYQSGDKQGFRPGGSSEARKALYLWARMAIVIRAGLQTQETNPFILEMQDYYRSNTAPTKQKIQRTVRRVLDRLFVELVREFER